MVSRRLALLPAVAAAFFAAAGASATAINPRTLQCDGTYQPGANTHTPHPLIQVSVQDAIGLRIGHAGMGVGNSGVTRALWRFSGGVTVSNPDGVGVEYVYTYRDPDGSGPMVVGNCQYIGGFSENGPQIPLGLSSCPGSRPALGAAAIFPPGQFGGAATFNGTDLHYGSVTYNGSWDRDVTYTLSAWIKSVGGGVQRIISEQGPQGYWGFGLNGTNGLRHFDSRDAPTVSSPTASSDVTINGPVNFDDGNWHQVHVVRIDGFQRRFYVDGSLIGTALDTSTSTFSLLVSSGNPIQHPVIIGMYELGGENFNGSINQIRVIDAAMSDEDIRLEYTGSAIHKYSSNSGVSYSTVPGSFQGSPANGTQSNVLYSTGTGGASEVLSTNTMTSQRWIFEAQSTESVTTISAPFSVTIDPSKPTAPGTVSGSPTSTSGITWSWTAPATFCPSPGSSSVYYQLFDAANGGAPLLGNIAYPATSIAENTATPNQLLARRLTMTDAWGTGPLSASASAYTLAAVPGALAAASVSTGGFVATWDPSGNSAYTRYELTYTTDPTFATGVSTPAAIGSDFVGTTIAVSGLATGTAYYVRVRAFNGRSGDSRGGVPTAPASLTILTEPGAPALTGAPLGVSSVAWSWTAVSGATGYTLFDSPTQAVLFNGSGVTFTSSTLAVNTRYDAEVQADLPPPTASTPRGHSYTYTLANAPAGTAVSAVSASSMTFTWDPNGNPSDTSYVVVVSTGPSFDVLVATLNVASPMATATGLIPGVMYYARVQALNGVQIPTLFAAIPPAQTTTAATITASPSPSSPYVASPGLVGAWQFDEDTGTITADATGGGNAGNFLCTTPGCVSTPTWAAGPPGLGSAASFSGAPGGVVLTNTGAPFAFPGSLSVEAWVYCSPNTVQSPFAGIVAVGPQNAEDFALDVFAGAFRFVTSNGGSEYAVTSAAAAFVAGQWTHVAGVYNSTGPSALYLNGRLAATANLPARINSGDALAVGNRLNASGNYNTLAFSGRIDSVRVSSAALTAAQVLSDYQGGFVSSVTANGVVVALPPDAFGALARPAQIFISADPVNDPIRVTRGQLNAGFTVLPSTLTLVPNSLVEVVPVVGGVPFTGPLGSSATLSIPYSASDNIISGTNPPLAASGLQMYTLNTTVNRWEHLPTAVDPVAGRASGVTPHFSVFALFAPATVGSGASGVRVYPVPWKPGTGGRFDAAGVTFANLPVSGSIRILSLSGRIVRDFSFSGAAAGAAVWNGLNDDGRRAASGVYFARIQSGSDDSTALIKFAIER